MALAHARDEMLERADALAALFRRTESNCFCEWWHFDGDKNAWLARLVEAPEANCAGLVGRAAGPDLAGVVALSVAGDAVGWMKLTAASAVRAPFVPSE